VLAVHVPVLLERVVAFLSPAAPGLLVDATVGLGGHAGALLEAAPGFSLVGLDRDANALELAAGRLGHFAERVRLVQAPFAELPRILDDFDLPPPAAILADLGCSSIQLDSPQRGFSFSADGPLDMRMGDSGPTAADLVNDAPKEELMRILWEYGEERRSRAIVKAIVRQRAHSPLTTTGELSRLVIGVLGRPRNVRIHPATRTFQALRIAVNDELGQLEAFLEPAIRRLRVGGRLAVISFHSLEDRIAKHTMRRLEGRCACPPRTPTCTCGARRVVNVLTRKVIRPTDEEIEKNPRSRSSRLRVVERAAEEV